MNLQVKLSDVLSGIEGQSDESSCYLDTRTGEIQHVTDYDFRAAENPDSSADAPAAQAPEVVLARQILDDEDDAFLQLPTQSGIHEYGIIERFCGTVRDQKIAVRLFAAIKGPGAFRRFKSEIHKHWIADDWYKFRDDALKIIAAEWCKENGVEYVDDE